MFHEKLLQLMHLTSSEWEHIPFPPDVGEDDIIRGIQEENSRIRSLLPLRSHPITDRVIMAVSIARFLSSHECSIPIPSLASILGIPESAGPASVLWEVARANLDMI